MADADASWRVWLALRMVRGVGPVVYQGLLRAFGDPAAVFRASDQALARAGVRPEVARAVRTFRDWELADAQVRRLRQAGAHLVTFADPTYPRRLRHIHDPPPLLFARGALRPEDELAVAVVGSRAASPYGLRMARELAEGLARHGVTVVSGLARGTDAAAHAAALHAGGRTIAVLGSGIDVVYPSEHRALANAIAGRGAVLSELPMGTQPDAENFPSRNRIISGVALGTAVVEAAERSGSLITASLALEQGRDVFAVPGPVGERTRGTHRLLRDGAKVTQCAEDILEEVAPHRLRHCVVGAAPALDATEHALVGCLGREPVHVDDLIARSGWAPSAVLPALLGLELKGLVQQLPGKRFVRLAVDVGRVPAKE